MSIASDELVVVRSSSSSSVVATTTIFIESNWVYLCTVYCLLPVAYSSAFSFSLAKPFIQL